MQSNVMVTVETLEALVRSCFYHFRKTAKPSSNASCSELEIVAHTFILLSGLL